MLKVFGSSCFVLLQSHEYTKLESRARLCCFLGYDIEHKGYHYWDPLSKHLQISRHVTFWEHKMFSTISSFWVDETPTPLFTNPNISLFPNEIFTNDSSSSLTQPTASPDESPPFRTCWFIICHSFFTICFSSTCILSHFSCKVTFHFSSWLCL